MSFFCVILFLYVCQFSCEAYLGFSRLEIVLKECTVQETRSIFPPSSYFASDIYMFQFHLQFVTPIKHFHLLQNSLKQAKPPVVNTQALQTYTLSRARMHTNTYRFTLTHSGMPAVDGIVIFSDFWSVAFPTENLPQQTQTQKPSTLVQHRQPEQIASHE